MLLVRIWIVYYVMWFGILVVARVERLVCREHMHFCFQLRLLVLYGSKYVVIALSITNLFVFQGYTDVLEDKGSHNKDIDEDYGIVIKLNIAKEPVQSSANCDFNVWVVLARGWY